MTCVHNQFKVIAPKGKRAISSEVVRGQTTTTIALDTNAVGHYVPSTVVFKRWRMKDSLLDEAKPGTIGGCSDGGWIETDIFMKYIEHFVKHTNCSPTQRFW